MSKMGALRRHLIAGLVVIAPITITGFVLWWIFQRLDGLVGRFIYPIIPRPVPGLGLLALVLLLVVVGWATERAVGARLLRSWHGLLERLPITRRLYIASNRIIRSVVGQDRRFLREVVMVEYPGAGRYSVGFLTGAAPAAVRAQIADAVSVFVPTAPNPTSGFLVMVPRSKVTRLPLTTEEAFTFILSVGSVTPESEAPFTGDPHFPAARPVRDIRSYDDTGS